MYQIGDIRDKRGLCKLEKIIGHEKVIPSFFCFERAAQ